MFCLSDEAIVERAKNSNGGNCLDLDGSCGSLVRSGEFVLYGSGLSQQVGQIVCIDDGRDIDASEMHLAAGSERERYVLLRQYRRVEENLEWSNYKNINPTMKQVQQTCCLEWVHSNCVMDIAFVFPFDAIEEGRYQCNGISNAFFVRSSESWKKLINPVTVAGFNSFWVPFSEGGESYSQRMWTGIASVNELSQKALSSKAAWDGRNKHVHMFGANLELFDYLRRQLKCNSKVDAIQRTHRYRRAKKRLNPDLSVSNKRIRSEAQMVRVVQQEVLEAFRHSMGSCFAVGITKPVPTMKAISNGRSDTVHLNDQDEVRIVTCRHTDADLNEAKDVMPLFIGSGDYSTQQLPPEEDEIERLKTSRFCPYPGIEFEYCRSEMNLTDLHFNLRFKKLLGSSSTVRRAQVSRRSSTNNHRELRVGDELSRDGKLYTVTCVTKGEGEVKLADAGYESDGTVLTLEYEIAKQLVQETLELKLTK